MTIKKALVNYSGMIGELKSGDSLTGNYNSYQKYIAIANTTTFSTIGIEPPSLSTTTLTARPVSSTNILTRTLRVANVSSLVAGSFAYQFWANANYTIGTATGIGGFFFLTRFGISDGSSVAGARFFLGMSSSVVAPTNVESNTLLNSIGLSQLSTDATQWYITYGGSTAQTAIALGTAIGAPTLVNTLWEFVLYASPITSNVTYQLTNLGTGIIVSGTLTATTAGTQLPLNTTLLATRIYRTNNATLLAVAYDLASINLEQPLGF